MKTTPRDYPMNTPCERTNMLRRALYFRSRARIVVSGDLHREFVAALMDCRFALRALRPINRAEA